MNTKTQGRTTFFLILILDLLEFVGPLCDVVGGYWSDAFTFVRADTTVPEFGTGENRFSDR